MNNPKNTLHSVDTSFLTVCHLMWNLIHTKKMSEMIVDVEKMWIIIYSRTVCSLGYFFFHTYVRRDKKNK